MCVCGTLSICGALAPSLPLILLGHILLPDLSCWIPTLPLKQVQDPCPQYVSYISDMAVPLLGCLLSALDLRHFQHLLFLLGLDLRPNANISQCALIFCGTGDSLSWQLPLCCPLAQALVILWATIQVCCTSFIASKLHVQILRA